MKTLAQANKYKINFFIPVILLGLLTALLSGPAMAQAPGKNKKGDKIPQATLKEAKVTARVVTSVEEIAPMRVKLNVLNPTGKTVRISIFNYSNLPVYQESFTGKEYNKILNFNYAETGRYMLRISGPQQVEVRRFAINSNQSRNLASSELENRSPSNVMAAIYNSASNQTEPNKIMLHVVNKTNGPLDYLIRNEAKEIVHRGVIRSGTFSKMFDLAESPDGKYTFEVKHRAETTAYRAFDIKTVNDRSFAWTDKRGRPLKAAGSSPITLRTDK